MYPLATFIKQQVVATGNLVQSSASSLGTATGNFTIVGSGWMGALSSGAAGEHSYTTGATYAFSLAGGNDLLLGTSSFAAGTGFDSATLKVTENGSIILNNIFSSYAQFLSFINSPTDLGAVGGSTLVDISLVEALSGLNTGQNVFYQLALAQTGTIGGQYSTTSVSAVPLPGSLPLFAAALFGTIGFAHLRRNRSQVTSRQTIAA
jgi:hypothetical protein